MNVVLKLATFAVAGTLLGFFATWLILRDGVHGGVANGPWTANLAVGNTQSDPYTRASVALHGLFALNRSETVYYTASADQDGRALNGQCRYEIDGRDPDARWWSITAYGPDDFLIPNPGGHYSVAKTTVSRHADGSFAIAVGGADNSANWIASGSRRFSLTLRLYNPGPTVTLDPGGTVLPRLKTIACS